LFLFIPEYLFINGVNIFNNVDCNTFKIRQTKLNSFKNFRNGNLNIKYYSLEPLFFNNLEEFLWFKENHCELFNLMKKNKSFDIIFEIITERRKQRSGGINFCD
jgi:hypothetical protein